MHLASKILIALNVLIHSYIVVLEMFLWESRGPKIFSTFPVDLFSPTKAMAANQGLYNGFLAAGLIWALIFIKDQKWKRNVAVFFLCCITIAGLYGAATVSTRILFVQTFPAMLALASIYLLKPAAKPPQT